MWETGVRMPVSPGNIEIICLAKTTKLMATMPTAIPVMASRCAARGHSIRAKLFDLSDDNSLVRIERKRPSQHPRQGAGRPGGGRP